MRVNCDLVKSVIAYSATASLSGDTLGRVLNQHNPTERDALFGKWVKKATVAFPPDKYNSEFTGKCSDNGVFFVEHLSALIRHDPFRNSNKAYLEEIKALRKIAVGDSKICSYLIGITLSYGYYLAWLYSEKVDVPFESRYKFFRQIVSFKSAEVNAEIINYLCFLVFSIHNLCINGYFREKYVDEFISLFDLANTRIANNLKKVKATPYTNGSLPNTYYLERVVLIALSCMYSISTAETGYTRPRSVLPELVSKVDNIGLQDLLMILSSLCTASEHGYPLFVKSIQRGTPYRLRIASLLNQEIHD